MGGRLASPRVRRVALAAGLLAWAVLCFFCSQGTPPGVDLPAHAAQIRTLAGLLGGEAALVERFSAHLVPGYGLVTWLMAPVAMFRDGLVATRVALFLSMAGLLPALALLLNRARLSEALCFLAAPFAFSFAYWYGFLPELFARTLAVLAAAAWIHSRREEHPAREALAAVLLCLVAFAHLLTFGVLALCLGVLALAGPRPQRLRSLRPLVPGLLVAAWSVVALRGAVGPQSGQGWRWDGAAHLLFFFRNYREEGLAGLVASLVLFVLLLLPSRHLRPRRRAMLVVAALCLAYLACPRDLGIAYVLCFRLPALAGLVAVCAGAAVLASRWRLALASACVAVALIQVVTFHLRFQRSVAGLLSVSGEERTRGYLSIPGPTLPWTRLPYLTHLGQWVTARKGGIGTGFFTDAPSQPVQLRPDVLAPLEPEALYVYGDGRLPAGSGGWCLERTAFELRRYDHRCLDAETAERDPPERRPTP
jgi:hypothetical protein